ncbi:MAG: hypothetical protein ACRDC6_11570, partial [Shewanella sp.]
QFILEKPGQPDEDSLGSLYVTVSDSLNQAPTIHEANYNYSAPANANPAVVTFQSVTVDLANLNNLTISDPESKEWQLIEVLSYSASAQPSMPNDVTNKKFTFQAGTVGEHIVSYIVGDHEGGYRMGLMSITVEPKEQAKTWSDIDVASSSLKVYASPLYSELKAAVGPQLGAFVEPVWDASGMGNTGNTLGAAGDLAATAYCSGKRLPNKADLDALRAATGVPATERAKYPTGRPYLISDVAGTVFQTYSLTTGAVTAYVPGVTANPYVMCVSELTLNMTYTPLPNAPFPGMINTVISDGSWRAVGTVLSPGGTTPESPTLFGASTNFGPTDLGADSFKLSPGSCVGGTCVLEARAGSSQFGSATAHIANGVSPGNTLTVPVTFLQNAKVTAATVTTTNKPANGTDENVVTLTLRDNAGNLVFHGARAVLDYTISATPAANPVISPGVGEETIVGLNGDVALRIKSNVAGTVNLSNITNRHGLPASGVGATVAFAEHHNDSWVKITDNKAATGLISNIVGRVIRDGLGNPLPPLSSVAVISKQVSTAPVTSPNILPVGHVDEKGRLIIEIKSTVVGTVTLSNVIISHNGSHIPVPGSVTVTFKPNTIDRFTTPSPITMNWSDADTYCKNMNPTARLPTIAELKELQALNVNFDSSEYIGVNMLGKQMCNNYGWPISNSCGGNTDEYWSMEPSPPNAYWEVNMTNGTHGTEHTSASFNQVVCVR